MRLNHVELFYTFLLHLCSKGTEERGDQPRPGHLQGWPTTAKVPCKGAAGCGLDSPQERPTMASLQAAEGGQQPEAKLQKQPPAGAMAMGTTPVGRPPAGKSCRLQGRPIAGTLAKATVPAPWQGGYRRARVAATVIVARGGQEGLGHSFLQKVYFTPLNLGNFEDCPHV
ncbi:hypothetical protein B296_00017046 [Ensete ventricosum]|uniref:Uncharacterized protein n=1 Tax=Ensete ventricosum TaxID=4639 RepID=A0A426ZSL4_ENSVE|nr:hypothetical protein B296_00017046 [Ensete ventricosum]